MAKRKLIAIAFSDIHLHYWTKFNKGGSRTKHQLSLLSKLFKICMDNKVPGLFPGDLFHDPFSVSNVLLDMVSKEFAKLNQKNINSKYKVKIYAISGNHDQSSSSFIDDYPPNYVRSFSRLTNWLECVDYKSVETENFSVHGLPYITGNVGILKKANEFEHHFIKPNILMIHSDYAGAKDTSGRVVDSSENIDDNITKGFDLVLSGHIHLYQKLSKDKELYMVGATHQQSRNDKNCKGMGFLKVYSDMSIERVSLKSPIFIDVNNEADIKDDYNYYTLVKVNNETKNVNIKKIKNKKLRDKKIIKMYCKDKGVDSERKSLLIKTLSK